MDAKSGYANCIRFSNNQPDTTSELDETNRPTEANKEIANETAVTKEEKPASAPKVRSEQDGSGGVLDIISDYFR